NPAKKPPPPATIAASPRGPSPLERAIPPQTTPTRPPMGNMASPRPARTRPATAQGRAPPGVPLALGAGDPPPDDPDQAADGEHGQSQTGQDQARDRPGPPLGGRAGGSHSAPGPGAGPGRGGAGGV